MSQAGSSAGRLAARAPGPACQGRPAAQGLAVGHGGAVRRRPGLSETASEVGEGPCACLGGSQPSGSFVF